MHGAPVDGEKGFDRSDWGEKGDRLILIAAARTWKVPRWQKTYGIDPGARNRARRSVVTPQGPQLFEGEETANPDPLISERGEQHGWGGAHMSAN
jgi:hypothetical protein